MSETAPRPVVCVLVEDERDFGLIGIAAPLGNVVALSARAPGKESVLPRALALGASRAVEVVDAAIADVDYLAVSHVLACAVRHLSANARPLLLAGDRGRAAFGPAVAERLGVPHLGAVLSLNRVRDRVEIERLSATRRQRYRGSAPLLLTCIVPAVDDVPATSTMPIETLGIDVLQITAPELRYRRRFRPEPAAALPRRASLLPNIERLGERLSRDGVWPKRGA